MIIHTRIKKIFINNNELSITDFQEKLKNLIKLSSSFLYFTEIYSLLHSISSEVNLRYIKDSFSVIIQLSLLNKSGFKVIFIFEISIANSFFGISYRESHVINVSQSDQVFNRSKAKAQSFIEEVRKFMTYIEKLKNPLFFKEFLIKLNDNILNL